MLLRRLAVFLALLALSAFPLPSLPPPGASPPKKPIAPGVQRERVNLVLIDAVVTDRQGRSITDLLPGDFSLKVDGEPQPIESVELQWTGQAREGESTESAEPTRLVRAFRRFVILFDGLNGQRGVSPAALRSVHRFLEKSLQEGDQVMLASLGRGLKIYQEFTDDPVRILGAVDAAEADPEIRGGATASINQESRIRQTLAELRALISYLHPLEGRKVLVYLTDGFPMNPGGVSYLNPRYASDFQALFREASAAQVPIHTVNTLGLPDPTPAMLRIEREATNTLAAFAVNTGGTVAHGRNDFVAALEQMERETRAVYLLAYKPPGEPDGRYHAVQVEIDRKGVQVRSRPGFILMTGQQIEEREILSAYFAPELFHALPVALEARSYLDETGEPAVELEVAVSYRSLLFLAREDRLAARLDVGVTFRSGLSQIIDQFSRGVEARLTAAELDSQGDLTLVARRVIPPGDYEAVAVVRDLGTGSLGATRARIRIPVLGGDRIAMSTLVLGSPQAGSRWVSLDPEGSLTEPAVVPSVRRIFPRGENAVGSCTVYHPQRDAATGEARVRVKGAIRKGEETVKELPSALFVLSAGAKADSFPVSLPLPLADLKSGLYTLEVQALDEAGGRGVVQHVQFVVE